VYDLLTQIGISPLVANFIAHPEWLHIGSAVLLMLLLVAVAYLIRIDLDPLVFGRLEPFSAVVQRLVFWPVVIAILLWTYYGDWKWPEQLPEGLYFNKFTLGLGILLVVIVGRATIRFVTTERDRWDFFDQLPFYMMVEFQFLVPLVYYFHLERNGLMPKEELGFAMACMFMCYFATRWLLGRPTRIPRNPVAPWLWLFLAYMLLTIIIMPYRLAAVKNVIQWAAFGSCFLLGLAYVPDKRRRDVLLLTAIIAALVSTLWGFWKYFDVPQNLFGQSTGTYEEGSPFAGQEYYYPTPSAGRYFLLAGFFANPNYYGEYLALTLFIGLGMLLATESRKLRLFLAVVLAINAFEMVALYNRAGWLGIFVGAFFVLFGTLWARVPVFKRITKIGFAVGIVVLALVLALTGVVFRGGTANEETPHQFTPFERLKSMTDFQEDETLRNRLTMWRAAYLMLANPKTFPQRLIFGGGFGFYEVEYLPYQTKVLETYNFEEWFHNVIPTFRAHNDHLQMLVEAGLIGTFFYVMFFAMFFVYAFRFVKEEQDPARRFYTLGIIGATACLLASSFFSFPLHKIQHGGLVLTAMGLLIVEIVERRRSIAAESEEAAAPEASGRKKRKKGRKEPEAARAEVGKAGGASGRWYITWRRKVPALVAAPLILLAVLATIWGVYTQIINFKSQYLVVKGITALRNLEGDVTQERKEFVGQVAADFFWKAYRLDPTNGRAEFFHGFALIKKHTYEDVVSGTEHLEEGQILYPQSDTFYALAMGYEDRYGLAGELAQTKRGEIRMLEEDASRATSEEERAAVEKRISEITAEVEDFEADRQYSRERAIESYRTAAEYYPVKVEYYKELLRLLEEEERYEEMIFWAERALAVDAWLKEKPPIRWQLYLWLGRAHRVLGARAIQQGNVEEGTAQWQEAIDALLEGIPLSTGVHYTYYDLAQIYEALGDLATGAGDTAEAIARYEQARDMYIQVFNRKDRVRPGEAPFDYAYFLLGRIYEKLGDPERAVNYYVQLMTESLYSPNSGTYQRARERIHELTGQWVGMAPAGTITEDPMQ